MFLANSFFRPGPWARWGLWLVFLVAYAGGLRAIIEHRRVTLVGVVLTAVIVVLRTPGVTAHWRMPGDIAALVFLTFLAGSVFADVIRTRDVTIDTVFGACTVYLTLGLLWAVIYTMLEATHPGSFNSVTHAGDLASRDELLPQFVYYSFITLATVGYGDITPVSQEARGLAMLEAILGQLYIAIMIARLVGLQVARGLQDRTRS